MCRMTNVPFKISDYLHIIYMRLAACKTTVVNIPIQSSGMARKTMPYEVRVTSDRLIEARRHVLYNIEQERTSYQCYVWRPILQELKSAEHIYSLHAPLQAIADKVLE